MERLKDIQEAAVQLNKLGIVRIGRRVLLEDSELNRIVCEGRDSKSRVKHVN